MEAESPTMYHLQAGGLGKLAVWFQSKFTGPGTRGANGVSSSLSLKVQKPGALISRAEAGCPSSKRERTNLPSAIFVLFSPSTD